MCTVTQCPLSGIGHYIFHDLLGSKELGLLYFSGSTTNYMHSYLVGYDGSTPSILATVFGDHPKFLPIPEALRQPILVPYKRYIANLSTSWRCSFDVLYSTISVVV